MSVIDKLKDLVYSQKRTVSIRDICYSLNVHISEAQSAIDEFVAEESKKDDSKLDVTYILSGSGLDSTDDCKVHKLAYAKAEELEEIKKGFAAITFTKIYSVSLINAEPVVENDINSEEPLLDRDDFIKHQKLTYIVNDDIQLRPDRLERLKLFSGIAVNNEVKIEAKKETKEIKTESKKDTKSSTKTSNRRGNGNRKQGKLSFGSKTNKKSIPNSSGDSGFSIESTPDPFTDDEEKSPEREEEQDMEVEPSLASPPPPPPEVESEDEKPKRKKIEDSEDEAIDIKETKKAKKDSKKRKRVRVYDSDEEDEDTLAMKILAGEDDSNHSNATRPSIENIKSEEPEEEKEEILPSKKPRKKSKPSQPMETKTVSEEFVDDEGYTQVRYVKKLVPVEENEEEKKSETIENGDTVKKETKTKVKTEKPAHKKQKTGDDEEEDSKPKGKKITKAAQAKKGLVSITSFFKPAAKV